MEGVKIHENGLHSMWCRLAADGSLELRLELVSKHMLHSVPAPCQPSTLLTLQAAKPESCEFYNGVDCGIAYGLLVAGRMQSRCGDYWWGVSGVK